MNEQLPTGLVLKQDVLMIIAFIMFVWGEMQMPEIHSIRVL